MLRSCSTFNVRDARCFLTVDKSISSAIPMQCSARAKCQAVHGRRRKTTGVGDAHITTAPSQTGVIG